MGEYKPLVVFLLLSTILNVFMYASYTSFEQELVIPENASTTLNTYFSAKTAFQNIISGFDGWTYEIWVAPLTTFEISFQWLGDVFKLFLYLITFGLFTDTVATLILIWATLPSAIFAILFIPMFGGAIYAIIKLLPTT